MFQEVYCFFSGIMFGIRKDQFGCQQFHLYFNPSSGKLLHRSKCVFVIHGVIMYPSYPARVSSINSLLKKSRDVLSRTIIYPFYLESIRPTQTEIIYPSIPESNHISDLPRQKSYIRSTQRVSDLPRQPSYIRPTQREIIYPTCPDRNHIFVLPREYPTYPDSNHISVQPRE